MMTQFFFLAFKVSSGINQKHTTPFSDYLPWVAQSLVLNPSPYILTYLHYIPTKASYPDVPLAPSSPLALLHLIYRLVPHFLSYILSLIAPYLNRSVIPFCTSLLLDFFQFVLCAPVYYPPPFNSRPSFLPSASKTTCHSDILQLFQNKRWIDITPLPGVHFKNQF